MTAAKPLAGWRVLVPRGGKWGDNVAALLRSYGAIHALPPFTEFVLFWIVMALAQAVLSILNRAGRDE